MSGPIGYRRLQQTCIGALDGILVETLLPTKRETKRRNDFRSGHKKRIGLNVQALCDTKLRFLLVSCICPGKTNDWSAYSKSIIRQLVEELPDGFYIMGDAAYVNSEHLLTPFPGKNLDEREDSFNFFQSQLRIRVEMAFAQLVGRWGIFWRPLRIPLRDQPILILATMKLHNFCINERQEAGLPLFPTYFSTQFWFCY
jgi:hypothetical protein